MERSVSPTTLRMVLQPYMDHLGISARQAAQRIRLDEKTFYRILEYGEKPGAVVPDAFEVKQIADFFRIDPVQLYRVIGLLNPLEEELDMTEAILISSIKLLPPEGREIALEFLGDLQRSYGISSQGDWGKRLTSWSNRADELCRENLTWIEIVDRVIASVARIKSDGLLERATLKRLKNVGIEVTIEEIRRVISHPFAHILLRRLLRKKDITSDIERLYYLTYPAEHYETLTQESRHAIRATWELLLEAAS